jgi:tetratricopeptide (TPR) repeat protein
MSGDLFRRRPGACRYDLLLSAFLFVLGLVTSSAEDRLIQKNGNVITGQVVSVAGGQVSVLSKTANGGEARVPYMISDLRSVEMTPPAAFTGVKGQSSAAVVAALAPLVKDYAGLPADWVLDAMGQLADAYSELGQIDAANAIYNQINQLYPGTPYTNIAVAGQAKLLLKQGKLDQALATIQPVITAANQDVAPSPADGRSYASAFLVYGQILEAQKKLPEALEAYLTVKTMFYQPELASLVAQSDELAKNLRAQNPGLGVN